MVSHSPDALSLPFLGLVLVVNRAVWSRVAQRTGFGIDDDAMTLGVSVLYVDGCPHWVTALERVHEAAEQAGVPVGVSTVAVETDEEADRLGLLGSPTILIGGRDLFARPGMVSALACRIYSTPVGPAGSPTVQQLVEALGRSSG